MLYADGINRHPRTIVCRLRDWQQKDEILTAAEGSSLRTQTYFGGTSDSRKYVLRSQARRIKPSGIFVNEDLANETLEKRKEQLDKFKEAKRAGKTAYFVLDRLVIKDRRRLEPS